MKDETKKMTIIMHLEELRKRIILCLVALLIASIIGFTFVDNIRKLLLLPAGEIELIYISPAEALIVNIRMAILFGIILAMPIFVYQFLAFILPALYKNEKKILIPTVFAMFAMFIIGVLFSYKIVFPFTITFFLKFATSDLVPMFTITQYISFTTKFLMIFGVVFQLPLLFLILGILNVVNASLLSKSRKYAIIAIAVIAAIITPPDVISQLMIIVPLWILFEIGILLVRVVQFKKNK
ncbi:twin-arginine translocase subunit TatC [Schnuerera sp.]|uniref:twin-arginine translocase subunit TatC n=1 Tax=Schnuerera sp. TaxID=2794844 RepID=UPI002D80A208|nr:twin-arginine translocase subunit TatC [Schnuerera sp.]